MKPERLNAFTDGVLAIVITIMVLELPVPHAGSFEGLRASLPLFAAYALSFINIGIFWNNHHHLMSLARTVDGRVLWANLLLLFWLTLMPFVIRWIGESGVRPEPVAAYGIVLTLASFSYVLLEHAIIAASETDRPRRVLGERFKEWGSFALYLSPIGLSFVNQWVAVSCYVAVAALWFVPVRRVERLHDE